MIKRPLRLICCAVFALWLGTFAAAAQDALPLTQTAEYSLGFDCPAASSLDPAGETLWVLMENCGGSDYTLLGFNPADGTPVSADAEKFAAALAPLDNQWLYPETRPFAFTPDGAVDVLYNDGESYDALNLRFTLDGAAAPDDTRTLPTLETVSELIPGYEGYLETTVYNADHTLAAIADLASIHIFDMAAGETLFVVDAAPESYNFYPTFSEDGETLYIASFNNPENYDDYSATLRAYSLPAGDLTATYDVPSAFLTVSPNGRYAAGKIGDTAGESEQLIVMELATGRTSASVEMYEPPRQLTACANDGRDMSDLDITVTGRLPVRDITWLADSSGFYTVQSYGGAAMGGGRACFLDYSRLRHYRVGD